MGAAPVICASSVPGARASSTAMRFSASPRLVSSTGTSARVCSRFARACSASSALSSPARRAPCRELRGVGQGLEVAPRDAQAFLQRAHIDVFQRHLGGERDLHVAQARRAGFQVGLGRLVCAPHAAEQVGLPHRIEAGLVETAGAAAAVGTAAAAARVRGRGVDAGVPVRGGLGAQRARLAQPGARLAHIGVRGERLLDQRGERRVVELSPPLRERGGIVRARRRPSPSGVCQAAGAAVSGTT